MSIEETYNSFDLEAIAVSVCLLSGYHAFLYTLVFCFASNRIQLSTNLKNSILWIKKHQQKTDAPTVTLAVQTLRNTILVAVFIGGYALEDRVARIERYAAKRAARAWHRQVKYTVRKTFADSRLRVKGRFVPKQYEELLRDFMMII